MARADLLNVAYALRKEGVEIVSSQDGRFPKFVILNPSHRLMQKAVKIVEKVGGVRRERFMASQGNCVVYWS